MTETYAAFTAPVLLAWSQADEPFMLPCDPDAYSAPIDDAKPRWWTWPIVVAASAAVAFGFAGAVGWAFATFTPTPAPPAPPSSPVVMTDLPMATDANEPARDT